MNGGYYSDCAPTPWYKSARAVRARDPKVEAKLYDRSKEFVASVIGDNTVLSTG